MGLFKKVKSRAKKGLKSIGSKAKQGVKDLASGDVKGGILNLGGAGLEGSLFASGATGSGFSGSGVANAVGGFAGLGPNASGALVDIDSLLAEPGKLPIDNTDALIAAKRIEELKKRKRVSLLTGPGGALLTAQSLSKPTLTLGGGK